MQKSTKIWFASPQHIVVGEAIGRAPAVPFGTGPPAPRMTRERSLESAPVDFGTSRNTVPPPNPGRGGGAWLGIPFRTRRLNLAGWLRRKFCGGGGGDTSPPSHLCTDPLPPPPCERGGCCPLNKAQYSAKPSVATRRKLNQRDTHTKQRKKHPKNTEKKKKQNKQTNKPNTQAKNPGEHKKKQTPVFRKTHRKQNR